jgi:glycosyltransferase involved in cell wall biosynthesis
MLLWLERQQKSMKTDNSDSLGCFISIVMITYNHEKYIRQALDSILMQNTDFAFEVIIGDDCSTDKTAEILLEYKEKYPHIIKPILRSENVGATKNWYFCFLKCTGKYIAILDGDDFWTDKNKLTTQIDFLEKNETYIACTQRYRVVDENNNIIKEIYNATGSPKSGDYTLDDFKNYIYFGHCGTLLFRNIFLVPKYDYSIIMEADRFIGDITLCLILTCLGKIYVSDDNMTSYRKVLVKDGNSYTSSISKRNQILKRIHFLKKLETYCKSEMNIEIKYGDRSLYFLWWSILYMLRYPSHHNWLSLKKVFQITDNKLRFPAYVIMKLPELVLRLIKITKKKLRFVKV